MSPVVLKVRAAVEREKSRTAALQQQVRRSARHCSDAERDLAQTKQVVAALRKPTPSIVMHRCWLRQPHAV